jgi:hypothetical protein
MEPIIPTFFCVGILVLLALRGIRKWVELIINVANSNDDDDKPEPMSDSVKHMYN